MKIYINNTLRQSADTIGHITQHLELLGWVDTEEDEYHTTEAYLVTGDVISLVTDGVTSLVTDGVTLFNAEKECQTICVSRGCEYGLLEGVTLFVTPLVTLFVTNKEEKTKKEEFPPCTPYRRKKQKKKKQHTQTRMHARKNDAFAADPEEFGAHKRACMREKTACREPRPRGFGKHTNAHACEKKRHGSQLCGPQVWEPRNICLSLFVF